MERSKLATRHRRQDHNSLYRIANININMIITVTINNNINMIVTTSITININRNSGCSFQSMHKFVLRVLVAKEKNWPDRVGGNLNAATLPQQTPPFNCPHPSSLALSWQPCVFVISRISFRKKLRRMIFFFFKYYETFSEMGIPQ